MFIQHLSEGLLADVPHLGILKGEKELDEFPFIAKGQKLTIEKNMVIAIEPEIVIPGRGVVGIENTHLVPENGLETFASFPDDIVVI